MTLGTPNTKDAYKVLLLGSGELGKEVVIELMRLGAEVHAADRYEAAPAMQVAHHAHTLDMTDAEQLKALLLKVKPHVVVPEVEAIATSVLSEFESESMVITPTAEAVNLTMNRQGIRTLAAEELGLPTSGYAFASSASELRQAALTLGFPCFVKPIMSSSGKGQSRLTAADQIDQAWSYAQSAGRVSGTTVIVEAQVDFDYEITLLTCRAFDPNTKQIQTHFCDPIGHRQQDGDYVESWQPMAMSDAALENAKHLAKAVTDRLGGLGVFGVELFVKQDQVWFSEVSPRPHDTGLVTLATQFQSEFELHARALLGLSVNTQRHSVGASAVVYANATLESPLYSGLEEALCDTDTLVRIFAKPNSTPKRRMAVACSRAQTTDQARAKAAHAASCIQVSQNPSP